MKKIIPVILAGGVGSRLWPTSTPELPKQFMPIKSGGTCFENALHRVSNKNIFADPIIICANTHVAIVQKLLNGMPAKIICEAVGRNTAPAISTAAHFIKDHFGKDKVMLVLPADHYIEDIALFEDNVIQARSVGVESHIITFGIVPHFAHNQYGYIQMGAARDGVYDVASFVEKPTTPDAQDFINSQKYLWNSGIFMATATWILESFENYAPDIYLYTKQTLNHAVLAGNIIQLDEKYFATIKSISFDHAIMEVTNKAIVLQADFRWRDLGGWDSLMEFQTSTGS
jgi:mannose-1-phosphate guanylyltransferase/mannose-6-phosphate isomerase